MSNFIILYNINVLYIIYVIYIIVFLSLQRAIVCIPLGRTRSMPMRPSWWTKRTKTKASARFQIRPIRRTPLVPASSEGQRCSQLLPNCRTRRGWQRTVLRGSGRCIPPRSVAPRGATAMQRNQSWRSRWRSMRGYRAGRWERSPSCLSTSRWTRLSTTFDRHGSRPASTQRCQHRQGHCRWV